MKQVILVAALVLVAGCTGTQSIFGAHPGVAKDEDGETKVYDTKDIVFLDHGDSFWKQLLFIAEGDSELEPALFADTFIEVALERRWVDLNEFQEKRAREEIIEDLADRKEKFLPKLDNGLFVIDGSANFEDYDFENERYRMSSVSGRSGASVIDRDDQRNTYFQAAATPPIVEPFQNTDIPILDLPRYRATDRFYSRLSLPPDEVAFYFSEDRAEKWTDFFADPSLRVKIVSEYVTFTDRPLLNESDSFPVFEHNVLCYIVHNDRKIVTTAVENSDIEGRSEAICDAAVDMMKSGEELEQANMRPSFSVFPDDAITIRGQEVRSSYDDYF